MIAETFRLATEYRDAQARLGAVLAARSLTAWSRVSPRSLAETGGVWLATVLALVRQDRARSRETAAAFYRLQRAVETGHTVPPLHGGYDAHAVPLGDLRAEWAQAAGLPAEHRDDDGRPIVLDPFEWPEADDDAHEAAARASLAVTGLVRAGQGLERVNTDLDTGRLDSTAFLAELDQVMAEAGAVAAGAADREALRGGRDLVATASRQDTRVLGWARVTDGDPCAWCAMLASRGAVYKSRESAALKDSDEPPVDPEDVERFHPLCHCQTVPVYSRTHFISEDAKRLRADWDRVTRGLTGRDAVAAWRRHFAAQRRNTAG
ncbi:VG15 protein [Kitasatospora purpeofusca]|uniref:VG15 protein n=1 Tax=Kitasatospora purpeofusca TaxID=67352 RepID=UPI00380EEC20